MGLPPQKQLIASALPLPETELTLQTTGKRRNRRFHYKTLNKSLDSNEISAWQMLYRTQKGDGLQSHFD
jgi:hypothetical protein